MELNKIYNEDCLIGMKRIPDNCMDSGTTAIACINTKRNYIGFELDEEYYKLANERIEKHLADGHKQESLF